MTDLYVEQSYYIYEPSETVYTGIIYYIINIFNFIFYSLYYIWERI